MSTIRLRSSTAPTAVPITFRALPRLTQALWQRMMSIGRRPFGVLATEANYGIFLKVILMLAEVKVAYAQMTCTTQPLINLEQGYMYNEMEMRIFSSLARTLPYPVAINLESRIIYHTQL